MSKNTESSAFRKIDIDQYNEDNYKEEEGLDAQSPPAGPDEQEVNHLLNQYPLFVSFAADSLRAGAARFEECPGETFLLSSADRKPVNRSPPFVGS
ncbi:hypothetical protein V5799_014552 [Amblyomma americanum]|uniref:Actin-related protein 2/3 complex subunit 5 n=1 Tax=Amblyomma americanum TaxID=6943 RepID=A0AAQ4E2Q1_AMBAM